MYSTLEIQKTHKKRVAQVEGELRMHVNIRKKASRCIYCIHTGETEAGISPLGDAFMQCQESLSTPGQSLEDLRQDWSPHLLV